VEAVVGFDSGDGGEMDVMLGMEVQQRHDGCGLKEMELNVVLGLDKQRRLRGKEVGGTGQHSRDGDSRETRAVLELRCGQCAVGLL